MMDSNRLKKPILVLGVGNAIQTDDGVGVHAVSELQGLSLPSEVELLDGGTAGLDLLAAIEGRHAVIVIDAVNGEMPPGTMYRFTPDQIDDIAVRLDSLHQFGLLETIRMAELMGGAPSLVVIVGVQPDTIDWGESLTATVAAVLSRVIERVRLEIDQAVESYRHTVHESKNTG